MTTLPGTKLIIKDASDLHSYHTGEEVFVIHASKRVLKVKNSAGVVDWVSISEVEAPSVVIPFKTANGLDGLLVPVPDNATGFELDYINQWVLFVSNKSGTIGSIDIGLVGKDAPKLLGTWHPRTEEVDLDVDSNWVESWEGVASNKDNKYRVYQNYLTDIPKRRSAMQSFHTLLLSEAQKCFPVMENPFKAAEEKTMPNKFCVLIQLQK